MAAVVIHAGSFEVADLSDQLTWGNYVELVGFEYDLERSFYEKQAARERWTIRGLKRQKGSTADYALNVKTLF